MAKLKIELEVNTNELFAAIMTAPGPNNTTIIGTALISAIMTSDEVSFSEAVVLEMYGIKLTKDIRRAEI